jgi:hypothetical protein
MVHHNFKKGKRIYCIKKDNTIIISKYIKSTGHYLELEDCKIPWNEIRSSTIYKNI